MNVVPYPTLFKYARKSLGLNQKEMAERLSVNQSTISKIESGKHCPRGGTMLGMARLTGFSLEVLKKRAAEHMQVIDRNVNEDRPAMRYKASDLYVARFRKSELCHNLKIKLYKKKSLLEKLEAEHYMHDLAETNAQHKLEEAKELTTHLVQHDAPAALLAIAEGREQEAAAHLALLRKKAIRMPTGYEILKIELEVKQLRARIKVLE